MISALDTATKEIRTFIAIELPERAKAYLALIQNDLKEPNQNFIKWVSPGSIHLTLKFLGNVNIDRIDEIKIVVEEVSRPQKQFTVEIYGLGAFPSMKRPRVIWVGIAGQINELMVLQKRLDDRLEAIGYSKEKRAFSPHLTLARIAERATVQEVMGLSKILEDYHQNEKATVRAKGLSFIRSQLFPAGPLYTTILETEFGD